MGFKGTGYGIQFLEFRIQGAEFGIWGPSAWGLGQNGDCRQQGQESDVRGRSLESCCLCQVLKLYEVTPPNFTQTHTSYPRTNMKLHKLQASVICENGWFRGSGFLSLSSSRLV